MSEIKLKLSGWQAVVILLVLAGVVIVRIFTLDNIAEDKALMKHIDTLLMDEYSQSVYNKVRSAYDTGDEGNIEDSVKSFVSTKVHIVTVKTSYPVFKFSLPKNVVIKVVYSLDNTHRPGEEKTIYYLFQKGVAGWQYKYITSSLSYYLNFI